MVLMSCSHTLPDAGITGTIDRHAVRVGKPGFIDPGALTADVVAALHRRGIRVAMLTGDNTATATALAAQAGIDDVRAELLPADKTRAVEQLATHGGVAMVGDGINDAPALASAQVGIAMGAAGSDIAIEAADIAIMGDQLTHLPDVLDHAVRTRRIMVQNLLLSGLIITVLIPVAALGWLGLGTVVATHELAEILVIANGLHARRSLHTHAMLRCAWRQRDHREIVGQLIRLIVAGPGSLTGRYPPGNTGRTTMALTEHGPIPTDLTDLLP